MRDSPPEDCYILAKEVVYTAAGLPLGSLLFGKQDKALLEERLRKLKIYLVNKCVRNWEYFCIRVWAKTDIPWYSMSIRWRGQHKSLLHVGWLRILSNQWDYCSVLRSLVKVGDDNTLRMHDQLRDLGRQIVCKESLDEPGERSRLWRHKEALDLFERRMVSLTTSSILPIYLGSFWLHKFLILILVHFQLMNCKFLKLPNCKFSNSQFEVSPKKPLVFSCFLIRKI